jgi:Na+/H+-dicarboxylate symporter
MKKYAIRIFSNMYANFVQPGYDIQMDESNNFDKWEQDNYNITIGDFLLKSFPNLFIAEPKDPGSGTTSIQ